MYVHQVILDSGLVDAGALLGTTGRQDLINDINSRCGGSSFFGSEHDPYRDSYSVFMSTVVNPLREARDKLIATSNTLFRMDRYRAITSVAELEQGIPPSMHMGIVMYEPVRKMLEEERIDGFGIKPNELPDEDVFGRLIRNGTVHLYNGCLDKDSQYVITDEVTSLDPEIDREDLDMLQDTRDFIDKFMKDENTKYMDFTDYPNLHA